MMINYIGRSRSYTTNDSPLGYWPTGETVVCSGWYRLNTILKTIIHSVSAFIYDFMDNEKFDTRLLQD